MGGVSDRLIIALWRYRGGHGALFVAIAGFVFLIVHLRWSWAVIIGAENIPLDRESPPSPCAIAHHPLGRAIAHHGDRMDHLVQTAISPGRYRQDNYTQTDQCMTRVQKTHQQNPILRYPFVPPRQVTTIPETRTRPDARNGPPAKIRRGQVQGGCSV